MGPTELNPKT